MKTISVKPSLIDDAIMYVCVYEIGNTFPKVFTQSCFDENTPWVACYEHCITNWLPSYKFDP